MSDETKRSKRPPRRDSGPLTPLQPRTREPTGSFVPWKLAPPHADESIRWQCVDGRWVSIGMGDAEHLGQAVVRTSSGDVHYADDYEAAMALARSLRTV